MYLMLQDKEVLYFDFDEFVLEIINKDLVPVYLRGKLREPKIMKDILYNVQSLKEWLSNRVLSLSRDNAKQIFALFQIPQRMDIETRLKLSINCKAVSIIDSYWLREDKSSDKFEKVNIRANHFKEIVNISLYGYNPTITENCICPDLTTQGLFRKAWIRDDALYLLKSDKTVNNINTRMEVLASKILGCFINKIDYVSYTGRIRNIRDEKLYVDKCKNFVGEEYSFVEAYELFVNKGTDYMKYFNSFAHSADIAVLDYILVNTDRHLQNYGYWMNNKNGSIIGLAPLFDFNCALVADYFNRNAEDTISQMFNSKDTLYDLAFRYKSYTKIKLDLKKFKDLRAKNKEYDYIFDRVLERCYKLKLDII